VKEPATPVPSNATLLDASGRRVKSLIADPNDVRAVPPGVYFVREHQASGNQQSGSVRKVVITK